MSDFGDVTAVTPDGLALIHGYSEPVHPMGLTDEQHKQYQKLQPAKAKVKDDEVDDPQTGTKDPDMRDVPSLNPDDYPLAMDLSHTPSLNWRGPTLDPRSYPMSMDLSHAPQEVISRSPNVPVIPKPGLPLASRSPNVPVIPKPGLPLATPTVEPEVIAPGLDEGGTTDDPEMSMDLSGAPGRISWTGPAPTSPQPPSQKPPVPSPSPVRDRRASIKAWAGLDEGGKLGNVHDADAPAASPAPAVPAQAQDDGSDDGSDDASSSTPQAKLAAIDAQARKDYPIVPKAIQIAYLTNLAQEHNIPVARLLGQVANESGFNQFAHNINKNGTIDYGASQFNDGGTAQEEGLIDDQGDHRGDPLRGYDAHVAHLVKLHNRAGGDAKDPNWDNAFRGYNPGDPNYLAKIDAHGQRYGGVTSQESGGEALADTAQNQPAPAPDPEIAKQFPWLQPQPQTAEDRQAERDAATQAALKQYGNVPGQVTDIYGATVPFGQPGSSLSTPQPGSAALSTPDQGPPSAPPTVESPPGLGSGDFQPYSPSQDTLYNNQLDQAAKLQASGIQGQVKPVQDYSNAMRNIATQGADDYQRLMDYQRESQQDAMQSAKQKMGDYQRAVQQVASMKVDPKRWWDGNDGANRALGFLGILVSSFSGQQQNAALTQINKEVANDIDAQKSNIANAQHTAAGYHNLFEMNQSIFKNDQDATLATGIMLKDHLLQQGLAQDAALKGGMAQPQANAGLGALQQQIIQDKLRLPTQVVQSQLAQNSLTRDNYALTQQRLAQEALSDMRGDNSNGVAQPLTPEKKNALLNTFPAENQIQTDHGIVLTRKPLIEKQKLQYNSLLEAKQNLNNLLTLAHHGALSKLSPDFRGPINSYRTGFETQYGPATGAELNLSSRTKEIMDKAISDPSSLDPREWLSVIPNLEAYRNQLENTEKVLLGNTIPVGIVR